MGERLASRRPYTFPNKMSRILLLAMEEVMGRNGLNAVLNTASLQPLIGHLPPSNFEEGLTFEEMGRLFGAVEGIYGIRGGQRLIHQTGQVCFKYGVQDFGGVLGMADFAFRVLPLAFRTRVALEVQAEIFNRYSDHHVILAEDDGSYFWIIQQCGLCWKRSAQQPACSLAVGLLDESLYWVSSGRRFSVDEISCIAKGDQACVIEIAKSFDIEWE